MRIFWIVVPTLRTWIYAVHEGGSSNSEGPPDFICEPTPDGIINKINKLNDKYEEKRKLALKYGEKYKGQFDKKNVAKRIIDIFNSRHKNL